EILILLLGDATSLKSKIVYAYNVGNEHGWRYSVKTVLSFLKPYKLHIFIAYSLTIIELVAELLLPFFLSFLINDGIIEQNIEKILFWSGMMLAITAITFISGILNSYFAAHVSVTSAYEMRKQLFHNIQR